MFKNNLKKVNIFPNKCSPINFSVVAADLDDVVDS